MVPPANKRKHFPSEDRHRNNSSKPCLLDLPVRADDEGQAVGELPHEGDFELRAVQVGDVRSDVRQKGKLQVVRLLEVEVLMDAAGQNTG